MGLSPKQKEKEKLAILEVNRRRKYFRDDPLQAEFPKGGIPEELLLGMRFQVSDIDFVLNVITFTLID